MEHLSNLQKVKLPDVVNKYLATKPPAGPSQPPTTSNVWVNTPQLETPHYNMIDRKTVQTFQLEQAIDPVETGSGWNFEIKPEGQHYISDMVFRQQWPEISIDQEVANNLFPRRRVQIRFCRNPALMLYRECTFKNGDAAVSYDSTIATIVHESETKLEDVEISNVLVGNTPDTQTWSTKIMPFETRTRPLFAPKHPSRSIPIGMTSVPSSVEITKLPIHKLLQVRIRAQDAEEDAPWEVVPARRLKSDLFKMTKFAAPQLRLRYVQYPEPVHSETLKKMTEYGLPITIYTKVSISDNRAKNTYNFKLTPGNVKKIYFVAQNSRAIECGEYANFTTNQVNMSNGMIPIHQVIVSDDSERELISYTHHDLLLMIAKYCRGRPVIPGIGVIGFQDSNEEFSIDSVHCGTEKYTLEFGQNDPTKDVHAAEEAREEVKIEDYTLSVYVASMAELVFTSDTTKTDASGRPVYKVTLNKV